ncbi:hypothetical protein [Ornithinimicrobium flavum]|uniref:hypothetical protein n=1 Tax=Ornithinimicrobium flavum TaxID=1288636 RepID=UPI0010703E45|nr:hypothetical protein [Ornithinimicrobium flavum]
MSVFARPPGSPDRLQEVAASISTLAETVGGTRSDRLAAISRSVVSGLPTARVPDYSGASGTVKDATQAVGMSFSTIARALGDYAEGLRTAQQRVTQASAAYGTAQDRWRMARSMGEEELAQDYQQAMTRERGSAEDARSDLAEAERRAAGTLSGEVDVWVPDLSSADPASAWAQASANLLPQDISIDPQELKDFYADIDPALVAGGQLLMKTVTSSLKGKQIYEVLSFARAAGLARRSEDKFLQARQAYQAIKGGAPGLSNRSVYRQYMKAERQMLKAYAGRNPADVRRAQQHYRWLRGMRGDARALEILQRKYYPHLPPRQITGPAPTRFAGVKGLMGKALPIFNKVMGPVAIITGGLDVYAAFTDDSQSTGHRWAQGAGGLATVAGGATTVLMVAGLVSNPVGWAVLAGTGAVAVGTWAYRNWDTVTETGSKLWEGAKDVGSKVGGFVKGLFG